MESRQLDGQVLTRSASLTSVQPTQIAVIADAHLATRHEGTWKVFHRTERHLRRAVAELNEASPDLVVFAGDLTKDGNHWEYDRLEAVLEELEPPMVAVPGNHDLPTTFDDHASRSLEAFESAFASGGFPVVRELGGVELVGLNSNAGTRDQPAETFDGSLRTDQLAVLETVLSECSNPLVTVHHNLAGTRAFYEAATRHLPMESGAPIFENPDELLDLLGAHDVPLVLTGHLHVPGAAHWKGVTEWTLPSLASFPQGYTLLDIDSTGTTARLHTVGEFEELLDTLPSAVENDRTLLSTAQLGTLPLDTYTGGQENRPER